MSHAYRTLKTPNNPARLDSVMRNGSSIIWSGGLCDSKALLMKLLKRLKYAIQAFRTIVTGKDYIFITHTRVMLEGAPDDIEELYLDLTDVLDEVMPVHTEKDLTLLN
jgi:hypothetical protein